MGSLGTGLWAQVAPQPASPAARPSTGTEDVIEMEAFSVTGSNVKRMDQENVLPVTVMSRDAMDVRNALTPVDMLTALPQVTGVPANESRSASAGARGDNANINMRGLGTNASLVLLNGRRLAPHPMTGDLVVNVNQLPNQGISQIEVLRDGASSLYGSDAIAGVVNYIMRTDYRGVQIKTRYATPEEPGGSQLQGTITYGADFLDGRLRYLTNFDVFFREELWLHQREQGRFADNSYRAPAPFNGAAGPFNSAAVVGRWPTFRVGTATATNYFRPVSGTPTLTTVAPTRAANPEYYNNLNAYSMASPRTRRINWFNRVEYDFTDTITAFADISLYKADSVTIRQPISMNAPTSDAFAVMSENNPFNPYGSRFFHVTGAPNTDGTARLVGAPRSISMQAQQIQDLPGDRMEVSAGTYRFVGGLMGKLTDTWSWETGALYTQVYAADRAPFNVRESLYHAALGRTAIPGPNDNRFAAEAGAFNPFGYTFKVQNGAVVADQPYVNPQGVMNTFVDRWRQDGRTEVASLDARASGRLFTMWAGDINVAIGGEYRTEYFRWVRPYNVSTRNDFYVSSPIPDNTGDRTVTSFYSELVIPLVAPQNNIPLANSLELSASARYESYDDFGNTTRPKVGLNWKPLPNIMVRSSYNEGFTAPSLADLYSPPSSTIGSVATQIDTYRNVATSEGAYVTLAITSGNPNLQPAESEGKSAGIVIDVPWVPGLTLTADYWEIDQIGQVGSRSVSQLYISDDVLLKAYVAQQIAAGVPVMSIDTASGTANYRGDVGIQRFAANAEDVALFAAWNAANPGNPRAVVGRVRATNSPIGNLVSATASGWDFGASYNLPELSIGRLSFTTDWSYLVDSFSTNSAGLKPVISLRKGVGSNAEWRGNGTASWRKDNWTVGLSAYYIGDYTIANVTTTQALYESLGRPDYIRPQFTDGNTLYRYVVEETLSFNGFVTYRFGRGADRFWLPTSVRLGVSNLTDEEPPLSNGNFGYDPGVHANLFAGRTWSIELNKEF